MPINMSITHVSAIVSNLQKPQNSSNQRFLVDSGAVYFVMPESVLKKLGIKPTHRQQFSLANGEVIEKPVGNALFEYRGKTGASPVVFGEEGIFFAWSCNA